MIAREGEKSKRFIKNLHLLRQTASISAIA